jgi:hypothetical protein
MSHSQPPADGEGKLETSSRVRIDDQRVRLAGRVIDIAARAGYAVMLPAGRFAMADFGAILRHLWIEPGQFADLGGRIKTSK